MPGNTTPRNPREVYHTNPGDLDARSDTGSDNSKREGLGARMLKFINRYRAPIAVTLAAITAAMFFVVPGGPAALGVVFSAMFVGVLAPFVPYAFAGLMLAAAIYGAFRLISEVTGNEKSDDNSSEIAAIKKRLSEVENAQFLNAQHSNEQRPPSPSAQFHQPPFFRRAIDLPNPGGDGLDADGQNPSMRNP